MCSLGYSRNENGHYPLFETRDVLGEAITPDALIEFRASTETRLTSEESKSKILSCLDEAAFSDEDNELITALANNEELLAKLVWVTDGSWRNNRIWIRTEEDESGNFSGRVELWDHCAYVNGSQDSSIAQIMSDFEEVFIMRSSRDYLDVLMSQEQWYMDDDDLDMWDDDGWN